MSQFWTRSKNVKTILVLSKFMDKIRAMAEKSVLLKVKQVIGIGQRQILEKGMLLVLLWLKKLQGFRCSVPGTGDRDQYVFSIISQTTICKYHRVNCNFFPLIRLFCMVSACTAIFYGHVLQSKVSTACTKVNKEAEWVGMTTEWKSSSSEQMAGKGKAIHLNEKTTAMRPPLAWRVNVLLWSYVGHHLSGRSFLKLNHYVEEIYIPQCSL